MAQYSLLSRIASGDKPAKARRKLKRRLKMLGELRDTQVHRLFFEEQWTRFPELGPIRDFLRRRERQLVKTTVRETRRLGTRKLEGWAADFCAELASCPPHSQDRLATHVL